MAEDAVSYELRERVGVVRIDDGKANALSPAVIGAINHALDRAEGEAGAVLLTGRPGRFCAGFDLAVIRAGGDAVRSLVASGAELAMRLYGCPRPVVIGCTGHALAMGAILLMAADRRVGAEGEFKIALNEVAIGMSLPEFAVELARERLSKRHFARAAGSAEVYAPAGAVDAGFLDATAPPESLFDSAAADAARLAELPAAAFADTKRRMRGDTIERIRSGLATDLEGWASL